VGVGLMVVLFGLVVFGVLLAPNLVLNVVERNRQAEERALGATELSQVYAHNPP
jgi:hypothetical protein